MADDEILHQDDVEGVIEDVSTEVIEGEGGVGENNAAIADLVALTGGESPTEAEHNLVVTKVNAILAALRNNGIVDAS